MSGKESAPFRTFLPTPRLSLPTGTSQRRSWGNAPSSRLLPAVGLKVCQPALGNHVRRFKDREASCTNLSRASEASRAIPRRSSWSCLEAERLSKQDPRKPRFPWKRGAGVQSVLYCAAEVKEGCATARKGQLSPAHGSAKRTARRRPGTRKDWSTSGFAKQRFRVRAQTAQGKERSWI